MVIPRLMNLLLAVLGSSSASGSPVFWWKFPLSDCGYDDITQNCSGLTLSRCEAMCGANDACGGFNYPHGIMKQTSCLSKMASAGTGTLYIKSNKPQPPPSPTPPSPPTWPMYDAINVWPKPTNITLCEGECLGPHSIISPEISLDQSCGAQGGPISKLVSETLGPGTAFRASPRTYNEAPYVKADSFCAEKCATDGDCHSGHSWCYIPSDQRWSSTQGCSPSSKYQQGCGCCISGASLLPSIKELKITCNDQTVTSKEGYTLTVSASSIVITASAQNGAAYGLATLAQLIRKDSAVNSIGVIDFVPLSIVDSPRFEWRGYMLDTSRHFIPVSDILKLLKGMYAAKLNTFHWHVVDSPSFPLQSKMYPELANEGSWTGQNDSIYSLQDQAAIAQMAQERFIELVMEIDTPAHTLAVAKSHPEMMSDCWEWMATSRYKVDVDSDDCMAMNPINSDARKMVSNLLKEAADMQGQQSKFLHIGGDEVKFPCWDSDPAISTYVKNTYGDTTSASYEKLQAEWTANVSAAAAVAAGKRPVLWQPTTQGPGDPAWDGVLPKDSVYMIWLNANSAQRYAQNGSAVVYTTPFYVAGMGSNGWLNVYNADIMPTNLTSTEEKNVLGAEICMWGESMSAGNLGVRAYQIGAAAAENFWTTHDKGAGPGSASGLGLSDRYNRFLCHLRRFDIDAAPVMPSSCILAN